MRDNIPVLSVRKCFVKVVYIGQHKGVCSQRDVCINKVTGAEMNKKHLFWIVPVCLIFGVVVGALTMGFLDMQTYGHFSEMAFCCLQEQHNLTGYCPYLDVLNSLN